MNFLIIIFGITAFLMADVYYDGKYSKLLSSWKKYYQMIFIAFAGFSLYLFTKKHPGQSKSLVQHATNFIKYMPVDKNTKDIITPLFDFTSTSQVGGLNNREQNSLKRIINSGKNTNKRSVSETKKKYIASSQNWKCKHCNNQLSHVFEVDHVISLGNGGSNNVENLVALCRECHGQKTAMENF